MSRVDVFVDTNVLMARLDVRDDRHREAVALCALGPLLTSNFVVDELLTLLLARRGATASLRAAAALWRGAPIPVERVAEEDEAAAQRFFVRMAGAGASFTDCTSFALVERLEVEAVLSFDRHFHLPGTFAVRPSR